MRGNCIDAHSDKFEGAGRLVHGPCDDRDTFLVAAFHDRLVKQLVAAGDADRNWVAAHHGKEEVKLGNDIDRIERGDLVQAAADLAKDGPVLGGGRHGHRQRALTELVPKQIDYRIATTFEVEKDPGTPFADVDQLGEGHRVAARASQVPLFVEERSTQWKAALMPGFEPAAMDPEIHLNQIGAKIHGSESRLARVARTMRDQHGLALSGLRDSCRGAHFSRLLVRTR